MFGKSDRYGQRLARLSVNNKALSNLSGCEYRYLLSMTERNPDLLIFFHLNKSFFRYAPLLSSKGLRESLPRCGDTAGAARALFMVITNATFT